MRLLLQFSAIALTVVAGTGQAWAQYGTSSGMFGSRSMGSTLSSGTRTFSAGATTSSTDTAGQISGSERFLRANKRAGNFIGTDSTEAAYAMRNFSVYGTTGTARQQQNRGTLRSSTAAAAQPAAQTNAVPPFQTGISAAFTHPELPVRQLSESLARHMEGVRGIKAAKSVQVAIQGDTAVLRGQVATARDRALLEQIARLEPGVWNVRNELTVSPPKASPLVIPSPLQK
jgi:osmotically-inducible protein OsmY